MRRLMTTVCLAWLALPAAALAQERGQDSGDVDRGRVVYLRQCAHCHGDEGGGDGPAAGRMLPRPRVFLDNSAYKIRTTPSGELPTSEDLFQIITDGLPGTAMIPFDFLAEAERHDVVAYIRSLSPDFSDEMFTETAVATEEIATPEPVEATPESIERGRELYEENSCWQCHGRGGRGNGESYAELEDDWQNPIVPTNLTRPDIFRGGATAFDVFRTISTGLSGTPMPDFRDAIELGPRWDLANYVVSLGRRDAGRVDDTIVARRVPTLPSSADDEVWQRAPVARLRPFPNVIEPPRLFFGSVDLLEVQALYSSEGIALRVVWDDRTRSTGDNAEHPYEDGDGTLYRGTDHPDQLAIQFPATHDDRARPYFSFGDPRRPTNLWWWRADTGETRVMLGRGAGRVVPLEGARVTATVSFEDGRYTMFVRRALQGDGERESRFVPGTFVPIAFSVWDGDRGEAGLRRSLTAWNWLRLEAEPPVAAYVAPPVAFFVTLALLLFLVRATRRQARRTGTKRGPETERTGRAKSDRRA